MCGIIGIIGKEEVSGPLLEGLKRLEYRGYDSAGIATIENGKISRRRAEGKIVCLETLISKNPVGGTIGIGHTRWATHGVPNEQNAHPHGDQRVVLVHNGIIENFQELRNQLETKGHQFETDTDTETVVKGQTAAGSGKPAIVDTGIRLTVPAFVKLGDKIRINTDTGDYIERADSDT